jgi:hypothetical protein
MCFMLVRILVSKILLFTHLTCDELIMKIMQSSSIHRFVRFVHTNILQWKHIWHIDKCGNGSSMNLWMNKCHTDFTSSNKFVCQMCFQCTISMIKMYKLWMNEFYIISITKPWDVKFMNRLALPTILNTTYFWI